MEELCLRAEQRGWVLLDGGAAEFEWDVSFGLIVDALNDYIGGLEPALLRALDDDALSSWNINREVPEPLFLSEETIGRHLARIYEKRGVPFTRGARGSGHARLRFVVTHGSSPVSGSTRTIMSKLCDHTVGAVTRGTEARRAAGLSKHARSRRGGLRIAQVEAMRRECENAARRRRAGPVSRSCSCSREPDLAHLFGYGRQSARICLLSMPTSEDELRHG